MARQQRTNSERARQQRTNPERERQQRTNPERTRQQRTNPERERQQRTNSERTRQQRTNPERARKQRTNFETARQQRTAPIKESLDDDDDSRLTFLYRKSQVTEVERSSISSDDDDNFYFILDVESLRPTSATAEPPPDGGLKSEPPPDGGLKAWLQVLGSFMLIFNTWGTMITFGDYQTYYESGALFQESSSNISWIGSIQALMVFVVGAFIGPVYDRGYLKLLLFTGSFGIVFGHMMLSLCTEFWQVLLAQGFVIGMGGGCLFVPSLAVVQQYFSSNLGLAVGITATGSSLGGVIYPIVFINLIDSAGYAWTVRAIGFIALGTLCIPLAVSQMRVQPPAVRKFIDVSAFKDGQFMLCVLACFFGYTGTYTAFFYTSFFGQTSGYMSTELALYLVPILNAASSFGRIVPNWAADKIGPVNAVIPGALSIGIILLCNLAVNSQAGLLCTAIFFGLLSGIFIATPPLLFMVLTKDKTKLGTRMGMAYAMVGLAVLPGGPGAGGVLQHDPDRLDWTASWIFAGVLPLVAGATFMILRIWRGGFNLTAKV